MKNIQNTVRKMLCFLLIINLVLGNIAPAMASGTGAADTELEIDHISELLDFYDEYDEMESEPDLDIFDWYTDVPVYNPEEESTSIVDLGETNIYLPSVLDMGDFSEYADQISPEAPTESSFDIHIGDPNGLLPRNARVEVIYWGNGHTSGTVPARHIGFAPFTITIQRGTLARTGYTFVGWQASTVGRPMLFPGERRTITGNGTIHLDAIWSRNATNNNNRVTIIYHGNGHTGGSVPASQTLNTPGSINLRTQGSLSRTGHTFVGWGDVHGNIWLSGENIRWNSIAWGNYNLNAVWRPNNVALTFNANGGAPTSVVSRQIGTMITLLPANPTRAGHTFMGWWTTSAATGGQQVTVNTTVPRANTTYWARWRANNVNLTFNANGGTPSTTLSRQVGARVSTLPTAPTRAGFRFDGWFNTTAQTGGTQTTISTTVPTANTTYWARWTPNPNRTLTFNANGGIPTTSMSRQAGLTIGSLPVTPTRAGHTFNGWWTTSAASGGTRIATNTIVPNSNTTYWARWTANNVSLTFNANGGTPSTTLVRQVGARISTLPVNPTRAGFTFAGWFNTSAASGGTQIATTTTVPTANTTYWARWNTNPSRTVTFNGNGGTINGANTSTLSRQWGLPIGNLPATPVRAGHTFVGWFTVSGATGGTQINVNTPIPSTNTTYWARWTPNNISLTFNANGGSPSASLTRPAGSSMGTLPSNPTRAGFTFNGWWNTSAASGGTRVATNTTVPTANTTYWARWTANPNRTITFNAHGGAPTTTIQRQGGLTIGTLPAIPTRSGHTFNGWWTTSAATGGTQVSASTVVPNANTTYWARWATNRTLTFNANGGTPNSSMIRPQGTAIGTLPTPTRAGFTFNGWWTTSAATGGTHITATTIVPNSNTTYWARWTPNPHVMIIFHGNGGGPPGIVDTRQSGVAFGILPTHVVREGYTFAGWWTSQTGGTQISVNTIVPNAVTTYWARWTRNNVSLTLNTNGGVFNNSTTVTTLSRTPGLEIGTFPLNPTRPGHTFAGWFTTSAASGGVQVNARTITPNVNTTYWARWTPNPQAFTFNANGGVFTGNANTTTLSLIPGTPFGTLPTPNRMASGAGGSRAAFFPYFFEGWWTSPTGGLQIHPSTPVPPAHTTYWARWRVHVTFSDGFAWTSSLNWMMSGDPIGTLPTPQPRQGLIFNGWWTTPPPNIFQPDVGVRITANTLVPNERTIYHARWIPAPARIEFNANGGRFGNNLSTTTRDVPSGTRFGELNIPTPTRAGMHFVGWYPVRINHWYLDGAGGIRLRNDELMPTTATTYHARWSVSNRTYADWYLEQGIGFPVGNHADGRQGRTHFNRSVSPFGVRTVFPIYHHGFDLVGATTGDIAGVPVLAVTDGVVVAVSQNSTSHAGWTISIRSNITDPATGNPIIFTYMHLQHAPRQGGGASGGELFNSSGEQQVRRGEVIGNVGRTGIGVTGYHLHFEAANVRFTEGASTGIIWSTRWNEFENRINPFFFYPTGTFAHQETNSHGTHLTVRVWDEETRQALPWP